MRLTDILSNICQTLPVPLAGRLHRHNPSRGDLAGGGRAAHLVLRASPRTHRKCQPMPMRVRLCEQGQPRTAPRGGAVGRALEPRPWTDASYGAWRVLRDSGLSGSARICASSQSWLTRLTPLAQNSNGSLLAQRMPGGSTRRSRESSPRGKWILFECLHNTRDTCGDAARAPCRRCWECPPRLSAPPSAFPESLHPLRANASTAESGSSSVRWTCHTAPPPAAATPPAVHKPPP